jgi:hypothetical protein
MRKLLSLCLIPAALWSQQYYRASGQTLVFTLTRRSDISNGVYFARLTVNGRLIQSTRFWKAR